MTRRTSNVSKSKSKSNHKHKYSPCLLHIAHAKTFFIARGTYCSVCGKIGECKTNMVKGEFGYRLPLDEELVEKYKDLPMFELSSYWQKYVDILNEDD